VPWEAEASLALEPAAHLRHCRGLIARGYRPLSLSVGRVADDGPLVTASVWHRPLVPEADKDALARRRARAAVALARLGQGLEVWPLLQHDADPRLRSYLVNWLGPLGADPGALAAALARPPAVPEEAPAPGRSLMDAILFDPETSVRRALILALGRYGREGLSPGEREALIARLLELYRRDPDAGIHGAASGPSAGGSKGRGSRPSSPS
jgi:hypothetical protein